MATTNSIVNALFIGSPWIRSEDDKSITGVAFKRFPKTFKAEGSVRDETPAATEDETVMMEFFNKKGIQANSVLYNRRIHRGKAPILQEIETLFKKNGTHYILSYSGHGCKNEDTAGAWSFQITENEYETITFQDIVDMWDDAKRGQRRRYLMIISDSCYSGQLVRQVHRMPRDDIYVQAACRATEECEWGTFTNRYVNASHTQNTAKTLVNTLFIDIPNLIIKAVHMKTELLCTPISSRYDPSAAGFGEIAFFDSFADMYT